MHKIQQMALYQKVTLLLIVVIALGGFGYSQVVQYQVEKTPVRHIAYSLTQADTSKSMNGTMTFELDENSSMVKNEMQEGTIKYISEILSKSKINLDINVKMDEKNIDNSKLQYAFGLEYADSNIISADIFYQNFLLGISSEEVFPKGIFMDLNEEIDEFDLKQIKLQDFYSILTEEDELMKNFKNGYEKYLVVYENQLNDKFIKTSKKMELEKETVKGDLYTIEINYEDQIELYKELMNVMQKDEQLKKLAQDRILKIIDLVESDYSHLINEPEEMKEENFEEIRTQVNNEFDKIWNDAFEEIGKEFSKENLNSDLDYPLYGNFQQTVEIFISNKNELRNMSVNLKTPIGTLNENFEINEYEQFEKEISSFVNYKDLDATHENQITVNFISNVIDSDGLKKLKADSERLNVNEETNELNSYFDMLNLIQ